MAKITISQLHTASVQELTNAELDATKGGLTLGLTPNLNLTNTAVAGQASTSGSTNTVGTDFLQSLIALVA
ncbi:hypothetical protein WA1_21220 [Scytonema hofmannii PCC 7110]|uniref:Bacteriocin n=1 Tax=Scytonema hofmannii PCC 7110 TaxID=128403 RepID=A0A139XCS8_9CYAN|nr:hypothetical protein [Scytonema hofmannii]KYC42485.1 hypothetical protein WA1_21220 [Scytonema hofmannii PCC 7110]